MVTPVTTQSYINLPAFTTLCGHGGGIAVCPSLSIVAVSSSPPHRRHFVTIYSVMASHISGCGSESSDVANPDEDIEEGGQLARRAVLTGPLKAPFNFSCLVSASGWLAFATVHEPRDVVGSLPVAGSVGGEVDAAAAAQTTQSSTPVTPSPPSCTSAAAHSRARHILLVSDGGNGAVHAIDAASRRQVGYVCEPGSLPGARGVAAWGDLVAVSAWTEWDSGSHRVHVFRRQDSVCGACGSSAATPPGQHHWAPLRVLGGDAGHGMGQLLQPHGLRFTCGGTLLAVADTGNDRISVLTVCDGASVQSMGLPHRSMPTDVEEARGPGGDRRWLVACNGRQLLEVREPEVSTPDPAPTRTSCHYPLSACVEGSCTAGSESGTAVQVPPMEAQGHKASALSFLPGVGLFVREYGIHACVRVLATLDEAAMASMSMARLGWMVAVVRGRVRMAAKAGT